MCSWRLRSSITRCRQSVVSLCTQLDVGLHGYDDGRAWFSVGSVSNFGDLQNEIYLRGLSGQRPVLPMTAAGMESAARDTLSALAYAYVAGSASSERTAGANLAAFGKHRIVPRMWRGSTPCA